MTKPPQAKPIPWTEEIHGEEPVDPFHWLRDKSNPEVIAYLDEENRYTLEIMEPARELTETLYQEMVGRIRETDSSAPLEIDGYHYYTRTEEGKQYSIHCRRKGSIDAPEEAPTSTQPCTERNPTLMPVWSFAGHWTP